MSADWQEIRLGDVSEIRRGSSPRPIVEYLSTSSGMPWVKISDATKTESRFINKTKEFIRHEGVARSVIVNEGDLILSNSGTAGLPKFMGITACIHDGWQVFKNLNGIDKNFLYYTLLNIRRALLHNAYDNVLTNLTLDMLRDARVRLPPLHTQKEIANTLLNIDEKIELNRKQNRTLEAIAQTLFKRWFVEFEFPDQNGQPYKSSGGVMQPSELGAIPVGWEVGAFSETAKLIGGGTPKTSILEYWGGDIPWFSVVDAPSGSDTFAIGTEKHITQVGVDNSSTKVLRAGIAIVSARGTVGRLALIGKPMAMNQSCYGIQGKADNSDYFTYLLLQRALGELKASAHGSVFDTITRTTFDNLKVIKPANTVFRDFEQMVAPFFQKLLSNCKHSVSLANLRDTLLPKLMSGELHVGAR